MGFTRLHLILAAISAAGCLVEGRLEIMKDCGINKVPQERIVGGDISDHGEYPWMVTLQFHLNDDLLHICGGAIINEHWVVTAAHCKIDDELQNYEIYVGVHKLSSKVVLSAKPYKVDRFIIHESYDPESMNHEHDIALIRTTHPIDIKGSMGFVNGICLPSKDEEPTGTAIVTGWGHTEENGIGTDVLHEVEIPLVSRKVCDRVYNRFAKTNKDDITESMICAGADNKDACQNDSGGPLMQQNSKGVFTLIGIVSHGQGCGKQYFPGVYTKVSAYIDWMDSKIF